MEGYSVAKVISERANYRIRPNIEMLSQGLANVAAGLSGTMPVAGSFSRTALNFSVGVKTNLTSVIVGLVVLVVLLFLAPLFRYLPLATLSAIIITAVVRLIDFRSMRGLLRVYPRDGIVAVITFAATLLFAPHIDYGIIIGVIASIFMNLHRSANPPITTHFLHKPSLINKKDYQFDHYKTNDHVMVVAWDWSITFANSGTFEDHLLHALNHEPPIRYVLVMGRGINAIDSSGAEALEHVCHRLKQRRITILFSGLKPSMIREMKESGLYKLIGNRNFFEYTNPALKYIHEREIKLHA